MTRAHFAATDLDNTIIYPAATIGRQARLCLVAVEGNAGRPATLMTGPAAAAWSRLCMSGRLIPVTTRVTAQYKTLYLPGKAPRYAITGNGADILIDGHPDTAWRKAVTRRLKRASAPFAIVGRELQDMATGHDFIFDIFAAEDLFFIMGVRLEILPRDYVSDLQTWATSHDWRVVQQGRRIYMLPVALDKHTAIHDLAQRFGVDWAVAGGDSWLDAEMLSAAAVSIRPAHGLLHEAGWRPPNCIVTQSSGVVAGQEILDWYLERLGITLVDPQP